MDEIGTVVGTSRCRFCVLLLSVVMRYSFVRALSWRCAQSSQAAGTKRAILPRRDGIFNFSNVCRSFPGLAGRRAAIRWAWRAC